jgi:hypothetical protein
VLAAVAGLAGTLTLTVSCATGSAAPAVNAAESSSPTSVAPESTASEATATASTDSPAPAPRSTPAGSRGAGDGDVDGDGKADELTIPKAGTLSARYSGGGDDTVPFDSADPAFVDVRVLGVVDADGDGHGEVFVRTDQGAAHSATTVFRYTGGHLRLMTLDGAQASLPAGGSTGFVASWTCRPSGAPEAVLATASGASSEPNVYTLHIAYYRFDADRLVQLRTMSAGPAALDALPVERDRITGKPGCGSVDLAE